MKKQCGNSVAVPVVKAIAREMINALKLNEELGVVKADDN